jgi:hypothetical protein
MCASYILYVLEFFSKFSCNFLTIIADDNKNFDRI